MKPLARSGLIFLALSSLRVRRSVAVVCSRWKRPKTSMVLCRPRCRLGGWRQTQRVRRLCGSGLPDPPADTLPNAASIDDPGVISDKLLDFCCITIFEACCGELTFRQNFNLEASGKDPNLGFDGGVLEISLDQGQTYQDILDAGGGFISGGYNRTISTDRGSPIAGRRAWSGNSGGFITTVVALPGIVPGGVLRWRMASDNSGSGEGWRIDTIDVTWCQGGPSCTPTPSPSPTPTATPRVTPRPRPTPPPRPTPR